MNFAQNVAKYLKHLFFRIVGSVFPVKAMFVVF